MLRMRALSIQNCVPSASPETSIQQEAVADWLCDGGEILRAEMLRLSCLIQCELVDVYINLRSV